MKCQNCGRELPENALFCGYCGSPQNIAQQIPPVPAQQVNAKKKSLLPAIIVLLAVVIALSAAIIVVLKHREALSDPESAAAKPLSPQARMEDLSKEELFARYDALLESIGKSNGNDALELYFTHVTDANRATAQKYLDGFRTASAFDYPYHTTGLLAYEDQTAYLNRESYMMDENDNPISISLFFPVTLQDGALKIDMAKFNFDVMAAYQERIKEAYTECFQTHLTSLDPMVLDQIKAAIDEGKVDYFSSGKNSFPAILDQAVYKGKMTSDLICAVEVGDVFYSLLMLNNGSDSTFGFGKRYFRFTDSTTGNRVADISVKISEIVPANGRQFFIMTSPKSQFPGYESIKDWDVISISSSDEPFN